MRIITWNCNMAFRNKAGAILALKPDILIVQECENLEKLKFHPGIPAPNDKIWFGQNANKGLAVFSFSDLRINKHNDHNTELRMIVPLSVKGKNVNLLLFAIWANNPADKDGQYVEQVWKAVKHYDSALNKKRVILAGDFNSNSIWDRKYRIGNHSAVVNKLKEKGIISAYHNFHGQLQGSELHPSLFLYRHRDKPYHLDYCFLSSDLSKKLKHVEMGDFENWIKYSDHVPLIVDLEW